MSNRLSKFGLPRLAAALIALAAAQPAAAQGEGGAQPPIAPAPAAPAAPPAKPKTAADLGTVEALPFAESTTSTGKIEFDLNGVWLLLAYANVAPGKVKTFPQLFKITTAPSGPEVHLLDVRLPPEVEAAVREASLRTFVKWVPSEAVLAALAANWAQLPAAKQKTIDEFLYGKIEYTFATPDSYTMAFPKRDDVLDKVLQESKWAFSVAESYRSRDLGPDTRIAQLVQRTTAYGVKSATDNQVSGPMSFGLLAAGPGTPLPFQFVGDFVMYRLAR